MKSINFLKIKKYFKTIFSIKFCKKIIFYILNIKKNIIFQVV